jgi:hypothetical protein
MNLVHAIDVTKPAGANVFGIVGRNRDYTRERGNAVVLVLLKENPEMHDMVMLLHQSKEPPSLMIKKRKNLFSLIMALLHQSKEPPSLMIKKRKNLFSLIVSLGVFYVLMLVLMAVSFWPTIK